MQYKVLENACIHVKAFDTLASDHNFWHTTTQQKNVNCKYTAAVYTNLGLTTDKHEFYSFQKSLVSNPLIDDAETFKKFGYHACDKQPNSKVKVIAKCEFCLHDFETTLAVINNGKNGVCCKQCDAIASSYSRFKCTGDKHEFYLDKTKRVDPSCIDVQKTIDKFGYDPITLVNNSHNKIVAVCKYCGVNLDVNMSKYTRREG